MFDKYRVCGKLVDIDDKRYSDYDISKDELSLLIGMDEDIIDRYDNWYLLDDGYYYFKYSYVFEELFMSEMASLMGVNCVSWVLAIRGMTKGIISKLYRKNDKNYYMYSDFCKRYFNQDICNLNDLYDMLLIRFDFENVCRIMNDIYGMLVMDLFSGQTDRGEYNFFFECSDRVRLAPLCDNGRCFGGNMMYRTPFGNYSLYGSVSNSYNDIYKLLNDNREFYSKLESVLDIDVNEVLKRTIDRNKIILNNEYKYFLLSYFDKKKIDVDRVLKYCKK